MRSDTSLTLRLAALVAAAGLLLTGCGNKTPDALVRREVRAGRPRRTSPSPAPARRPRRRHRPSPRRPVWPRRSTQAGDKIVLTGGQNVTLPALSAKLNKPDLLKETAPGEWLLNKTIEINQGASLKVARTDGPLAQAAQRRRRVRLGQGARRRPRHQRHLRHLVEQRQGHGRRGLPQRPRLTCWPATAAQMTIDKAELHVPRLR